MSFRVDFLPSCCSCAVTLNKTHIQQTYSLLLSGVDTQHNTRELKGGLHELKRKISLFTLLFSAPKRKPYLKVGYRYRTALQKTTYGDLTEIISVQPTTSSSKKAREGYCWIPHSFPRAVIQLFQHQSARKDSNRRAVSYFQNSCCNRHQPSSHLSGSLKWRMGSVPKIHYAHEQSRCHFLDAEKCWKPSSLL